MVKFQPSKLAMRVRFPLPAHFCFTGKSSFFLNIPLAFSGFEEWLIKIAQMRADNVPGGPSVADVPNGS
jgi:hypothetical protein